MVVAVLVLMVLVAVALALSVKIASEHERAVIFRLGRLIPEPKGPGLFLVIPLIDRMIRVNLLMETLAEAVHAEEAVGMGGVVQDERTVLLNRRAPRPARSGDGTPLVPGRAVVVEGVDDDLRVVVRSEVPDTRSRPSMHRQYRPTSALIRTGLLGPTKEGLHVSRKSRRATSSLTCSCAAVCP